MLNFEQILKNLDQYSSWFKKVGGNTDLIAYNTNSVNHVFLSDFNSSSIEHAGRLIGAGFATVGLAGAGIGIGLVFCGFLIGAARIPEKVEILFFYTLLGFALTEAIALFSLMMSFIIMFAL